MVHNQVCKLGIIYQMVLGDDGLIYCAASSGTFRLKPISEDGGGPYLRQPARGQFALTR
jgi:hypothetical protein